MKHKKHQVFANPGTKGVQITYSICAEVIIEELKFSHKKFFHVSHQFFLFKKNIPFLQLPVLVYTNKQNKS
jgi:hypothetical protein